MLRISLMLVLCLAAWRDARGKDAICNVKDYGATGRRGDNAQPAIQKAMDACAAAGGGTVYLPPGAYTSGTLHLRSRERLRIDAGATLFASRDSRAFDKDALLYGENLDNVTLEGRGVIDGQAEYEWRLDDLDDAYIRENALLMKSLGKPLLRPFPKNFPREKTYPKLVMLVRSRDVRITGLSLVRSRSWTIHPYACERLVIDGVYIHSDLKDAVWADGIDPDGCKDVRIANSTIETGDDAIVFYSSNAAGPALACENITVTNCRLSSASSALKFCDGNMVAIRRVTVSNSVITGSNRGLAFMVFDGGEVSDVVLSNLTVECRRHAWFWWGDGDPIHFNIKRRSEIHGQAPKENEPKAGSIRNVTIRDVVARGQGTSMVHGHPESWLEGIRMENIRLFVSHDPETPLEKAVHAMQFRWARNLKLKDVEVVWDKPESGKWESALSIQDVEGLELDGFSGRQAKAETRAAAVVLNQVQGGIIRHSKAPPGTGVFVHLAGERTRDVTLFGNDFQRAWRAWELAPEVRAGTIRLLNNITAGEEKR